MQHDATSRPSTEPVGPPAEDRFAHGVRQTWELEMLISGAVAFALLQLPSAVDRAYERLDPHLAGNLASGLFLVYYYVKLALYTLIASFLVHLASRAYWVGLIGLEAVFPRGMRWDKMTSGPITRRFYEERLPSVSSLIDRADDFCSMIFSFSFMIVFIFVVSILWAGILGFLAFWIACLLFAGDRLGEVFRVLALLALLPIVVAPLLDKAIGGRLDPAGWPARALRGMTGLYYRALCMGLYAPIMTVLVTNVRKRMIYSILTVVIVGVLGFFFVNDLMGSGLLAMDSDVYVPAEPGMHGVSPEHYEDQRRDDEVFRTEPSIQSDIIRDPYVKLFIPYYPRRHNPALAQRCPGGKPLQEEGLRFGRPGAPPDDASAAVLRCLADIHRVSLDGRPLPGPGLDVQFSTHPKTGVRGILGYIPVTGLAPGSHLLRVEAVPRPGEKQSEPYFIRFWL